MNKPHVEKLIYQIKMLDSVDYDKASPVSKENDVFKVLVDNKYVIFEIKEHFSNEFDARVVADDFLEKWKIIIGLQNDPRELDFEFKKSEIIDLEPPSPREGHVALYAEPLVSYVTFSEKVTVHVGRNKFPDFPDTFLLSPDVETMYLRYCMYRKNQETLTSMANMCLTVFLASAGGRKEASAKYNISKSVLRKLSELCALKGEKHEARKAPKDGNYVGLTAEQRLWIESVVKALILRAGEWAYGPEATFEKISMDQFVTL